MLALQSVMIAVAGDFPCVAEDFLTTVDVSDPTQPIQVGFYDTPLIAFGVAVQEENAYISECMAGLRVVVVSAPTKPIDFRFHAMSGYAFHVAAEGQYVYIADAEGGLIVFRQLTHKVYLPVVLRAP